ncbi:hypothetical protein EDB86DRAFT_2829166 [Lactarius hatsudake]|nr:hypothetical protein EDB86DRAFT_2829166 [Lactarius hatsudake]
MGLRSFARAVVGSVVGLVVGTRGTVDKTDGSGSSLLSVCIRPPLWVGDLVFGRSAESVTKRTPVIVPEASTTPATQGRRSHGPDNNFDGKLGARPGPYSEVLIQFQLLTFLVLASWSIRAHAKKTIHTCRTYRHTREGINWRIENWEMAITTLATEELACTLAPAVKDVPVKYMDGMMSVLLSVYGIFEHLTQWLALADPVRRAPFSVPTYPMW